MVDGPVAIDANMKFIPLVVAPNGGMPSNAFTELLVMQQALPMITEFNGQALAPAIITWRDLQLLEGITESSPPPGRITELLVMWRMSNHLKVTRQLGLPESLPDFVDNNFTFGRPVSEHDRQAHLPAGAGYETARCAVSARPRTRAPSFKTDGER